MASLAELLSAQSPVYAAARKKYGIAPDKLVTPPGLMPGSALRSRMGQVPNLTRQNMVAAGRPPGPFDRAAMGGGLNLAAVRQQPVAPGGALASAMNAPPAAPTNYAGFTQAQLLEGAQSGAQAASRVAARSNGRVGLSPPTTYEGPEGPIGIQGLRGLQPQRINPLQDRFDAYKARLTQTAAGRQEAIAKRGEITAMARRERIASRNRVPSPLEQMAARNPAFALQLAQMNQRGQIAQGELGLRRFLGEGQLGMEQKRLGLQETLGGQQSADRRYVADAQSKAQATLANQQSRDAAIAAGAQLGLPGAEEAITGLIEGGQQAGSGIGGFLSRIMGGSRKATARPPASVERNIVNTAGTEIPQELSDLASTFANPSAITGEGAAAGVGDIARKLQELEARGLVTEKNRRDIGQFLKQRANKNFLDSLARQRGYYGESSKPGEYLRGILGIEPEPLTKEDAAFFESRRRPRGLLGLFGLGGASKNTPPIQY